MALGILFSLLSSFGFSLSNLLEKIAIDRMPEVSPRKANQMFQLLRTSRLWLAGFLIGGAAVVLAVIAYSLAPIAVVQSILGAGLVVIVAASRLYLREPIRRREWFGLSAILVAIVLVSTTVTTTKGVGTRGSLVIVVSVDGVTLLTAIVAFAILRRLETDHSITFGTTAGLLYGIAALQVKAASSLVARYGTVGGVPRILGSPYPYVFVLASILGLAIFQTGLQRSRVAVVAPLTNTIASVYVVAVGMIIFNERLPRSPTFATIRFVGFALVLIGSWFFVTGPSAASMPASPTKPPPQTSVQARNGQLA